jgi:autotransporter-associated beta strand protein
LSLTNANPLLDSGLIVTNGSVTTSATSRIGGGQLSFAQTTGDSTSVTLNNATQTISSLSTTWTDVTGTESQRLTLNGTALTIDQATNTTFGNGAVGTLTGTIEGTGSVIKTGGGTLTLSGVNTYSGTTTVNNGNLTIASGGALGTGAVTVNGGTLQVNGTVGGSVTVNSGGTLAGTGTIDGVTQVNAGGFLNPGTSPGILTFNDNLSNLGTINMEINGTGAGLFDVLRGDNANIFTFGGTLALSTGYAVTAGDTIALFQNWSAFSGTFANITGTDLGAGLFWDTSTLATNGTIVAGVTAIPEPTSIALIGVGLGLGLVTRMRRKKKTVA